MGSKSIGILKKAEPYLFFIIILLNLFPILLNRFIPTLDGPAHLNNSNILYELIFGHNTEIESFFSINTELVPNWFGHFFLTLFNSFLPAIIAEKVMQILYLVGLPLAFRYFIKVVYPQNYLLSYLIIPFTYTSFFFLGFYNFCFSIPIFFLALAHWYKNYGIFSIKRVLIFFLYMMMLYFSHVFVFGVLIFSIGIQMTYDFVIVLFKKESNRKPEKSDFIRNIYVLIIGSGVWVTLFMKFFIARESGEVIFLPSGELTARLLDIRPMVSFNVIDESPFTIGILMVLILLLLISCFTRIKNVIGKRKEIGVNNFFLQGDLWIIIFAILLVMYYVVPDGNSYSGFISLRFNLMIFLVFLVWLIFQKIHKWVSAILVVAVLAMTFYLNTYYSRFLGKTNSEFKEMYELSSRVEAYSTVLPINFTGNWLYGHLSNYLGAEKPLIILENYECSYGYFPVKWNYQEKPDTRIGKYRNTQICIYWESNENGTSYQEIDYILIMKPEIYTEDPCFSEVKNKVEETYVKVYETPFISLYKNQNI